MNKEKSRVTTYMSLDSKAKLDHMAKELTHTDQGRSLTLDVIIEFANAHFVNVKAWFDNRGEGEIVEK